jgi:hypothetical protein
VALVSWVLMAAAPVDTSLSDADPAAVGQFAQNNLTTQRGQVTARPGPANASHFEPAPVPDTDLAAPSTPEPTDTGLQPAIFSKKEEYQGSGFSRGSTAPSLQPRARRPALGLNFSMPVQ